jgi:hypothetical protein
METAEHGDLPKHMDSRLRGNDGKGNGKADGKSTTLRRSRAGGNPFLPIPATSS